ncbi:MAG: COX15/CtaA family protein [Bacteroidota bacterium]
MNNRISSTAPIVKRYRSIATVTVGAVIFLILVGGLVRMTGSGMGCPDWPKCFGYMVPPSNPEDIEWRAGKEYPKGVMIVKGEALWEAKETFTTGDSFDPDNWEKFTAHDYAIYNPLHTWIEYINRLIGVLIGGFALLTLGFAFPIRRMYPRAFWFSVFGLFMILVQGGIGAYVVRTNLETGAISIHMLIALLIVALYIFALLATYKERLNDRFELPKGVLLLGWVTLILTLVQIIMGTQVREEVDILAKTLGESQRDQWIDSLAGSIYDVHKYFYYAVTAAAVLWGLRMRPLFDQSAIKYLTWTMWGTLVAEILLGIGMHRLDIPAVFQPSHLLLATMLFASAFALLGIMILGKIRK